MLLSVRPEKAQLVAAGNAKAAARAWWASASSSAAEWLYRVGTPVGDLMVLSPNDGRDALDEGQAAGIDWPDHCTRLLPADEADRRRR